MMEIKDIQKTSGFPLTLIDIFNIEFPILDGKFAFRNSKSVINAF